MDEKMLSKLHIVAVTAIVVRDDGRMLVMKRSDREVVFPSKWTVPGGKFTKEDYASKPPTTASYQGWYGVTIPAVQREVLEEANIQIDDVRYLTDYAFIRPDGISVLGLSFWARYKSGEVKPGADLVDFAWVTAEEAKGYDLIEGIGDELFEVARILKGAATPLPVP